MPQVGQKWLFVTVVTATSRYTMQDAVPLQQVMAYHVTVHHIGQQGCRIKHLEQELKPCKEVACKLEAVNGGSSTIDEDHLYKQPNPKGSKCRS
jgi:hypothetical protein